MALPTNRPASAKELAADVRSQQFAIFKSEALASLGRTVSQRTQAVTGSVRRDQLLAAVTVPFVIVTAMVASVVVKDIVLGLLPDSVDGMPGMQILIFLLGVGLAIGTLAVPIFWVKTGGFGVFE